MLKLAELTPGVRDFLNSNNAKFVRHTLVLDYDYWLAGQMIMLGMTALYNSMQTKYCIPYFLRNCSMVRQQDLLPQDTSVSTGILHIVS